MPAAPVHDPGDTPDDLDQAYAFLRELRDIGLQAQASTGSDAGMHLYSFAFKYLRGTTAWDRMGDDLAQGATLRGDLNDILQEIFLHDASSSLPFAAAEEFHAKVRGLVPSTTPKGHARRMLSFPSQPLCGF